VNEKLLKTPVFETPRVSVVIPTYNRPEFLDRAMQSVLAQTYGNFELLVVHNGPFLELRNVVMRHELRDSRVKYHYLEKANPVTARNYGIENSKGEYIAFLDDDDEWLSTKLEKQVAKLTGDLKIGLVACCAEVVFEDQTNQNLTKLLSGRITFKKLMVLGVIIRSLSCVMVRQSCLKSVGVLNPIYPIVNDYDLYLRIAKYFDIWVGDEILAKYYWHNGNMTNNVTVMCRETIDLLKSFRGTDLVACRVSQRLLERIIRSRQLTYAPLIFHSIACNEFDAGHFGKAFCCYCKAIFKNPLIGSRIRWGRFNNYFYKILRPYLAALYCGVRFCLEAPLSKSSSLLRAARTHIARFIN